MKGFNWIGGRCCGEGLEKELGRTGEAAREMLCVALVEKGRRLSGGGNNNGAIFDAICVARTRNAGLFRG